MKRQIIAKINNIANELDRNGLYAEATTLTNVMKKLAIDRFRDNDNFDEMWSDMDDDAEPDFPNPPGNKSNVAVYEGFIGVSNLCNHPNKDAYLLLHYHK